MPDTERNIRILPPEEARRIAAGEVIEKPASLVREFLDNAIDSGGRSIEVTIEEGGIRLTEVSDDGSGMEREDLELCWLTHATSKIRSLDDLSKAGTLGFRGEALSAAAAVSRLEIVSSKDGKEAWKLSVGPGESRAPLMEQSRRTKGTSVRSIGLYDTIPARKRFSKRSGSEAAACRQIFNEKAMAFPGVSFRYTQDGVLKTFLPPVSSLGERFRQIFLEESEGAFLHEISSSGSGFSITVVAGGPELSRQDRRLQYVFANSRRIQDYSLLQALEYGLQGWFPNGTHPLGAVFIYIDPALADFNIHPAKREARFADPGAIHHAVSSALRDFCRRGNMAASLRNRDTEEGADFENYTKPSLPSGLGERYLSDKSFHITTDAKTSSSLAAEAASSYSTDEGARYLGQIFGLFILIEKEDRLLIIDQHAAHERILYDSFIKGSVPKQELLVPIPFSTGSADGDSFLEEKREELAKLGIVLGRDGNEWLIEALPSAWKLSDSETVEEILKLKSSGENIAERWAATLSCHAAIKDGDFLDAKTALTLAEEVFTLPVPRCPHGRPIWFEISRSDLLKAVKRV